MKLPPSRLLRRSMVVGLCALPLLAYAQAYPLKPITFVVGYSPGGKRTSLRGSPLRRWARPPARLLSSRTRAVAHHVATGFVAKAPADGYTLLANEMTQTIVPSLFPKLTFDPIKDLAPITVFAEAPYVLVVNSNVPARTCANWRTWQRRNLAS